MAFGLTDAEWKRPALVLLVLAAGTLVWHKACLPGIEMREKAGDAEDREQRIDRYAHAMIVGDPVLQVDRTGADGEKLTHPQRLYQQQSAAEVQQSLGAPNTVFPDSQGGQHMTWTGTRHRLIASFDKGALYNLRYENIKTSHGVSVWATTTYWQAF